MPFRRFPLLGLRRLTVGRKFGAVLLVVLGASLSIAIFSLTALGQAHDRTNRVYQRDLPSFSQATALSDALDLVKQNAQVRASAPPSVRTVLDSQMDSDLVPRLKMIRTNLTTLELGDANASARLQQIATQLLAYYRLRGANGFRETDLTPSGVQAAAALSKVVALSDGLLGYVTNRVDAAKRAADRAYRIQQTQVRVGIGISLFVSLAAWSLLMRNMVPRLRRSAWFATEFAGGRPTTALKASGADELAQLARALNVMVSDQSSEAMREGRQKEFIEALQGSSSEEEAHDLLQRHLQRSLPDSSALVLKRNNSANRLQPATVSSDADINERLVGASPRSCTALRFARTHHETPGVMPLIDCGLCGCRDQCSTCEPLIVSGEVIGSVLVSHDKPLLAMEDAYIKTSVVQAAPVLANLRNLAIAEFRANNDSLTGLPNKRATDDTLKRLVAQANRSLSPLAAIMLDLDHFKQINDRYGHNKGDEVLAAVGTAIASSLRDSDFAGRFGGEEFLLLLPDTTPDGAMHVAEKMRHAIASIQVPGVEREITASLGVADLLEHGGNTTGLIRESDRALYAAKLGGRNRTVTASDIDASDLGVSGIRSGMGSGVAIVAPREVTDTAVRSA